ncbi:MAG: STAS domain-containing protein [Candidatus Omnitrophota bacterium]
MRRIIDYIRNHGTILRIDHLIKGADGRLYPHIKEVKEIPNLIIIRFKGNIDSGTLPILGDNLDDILEHYLDKNVLLDFTDVTHVDTSTLASLVLLLDKLQKRQKRLGIINARAVNLDDHINIGKIENLIRIYESEEKAIEDLA